MKERRKKRLSERKKKKKAERKERKEIQPWGIRSKKKQIKRMNK